MAVRRRVSLECANFSKLVSISRMLKTPGRLSFRGGPLGDRREISQGFYFQSQIPRPALHRTVQGSLGMTESEVAGALGSAQRELPYRVAKQRKASSTPQRSPKQKAATTEDTGGEKGQEPFFGRLNSPRFNYTDGTARLRGAPPNDSGSDSE